MRKVPELRKPTILDTTFNTWGRHGMFSQHTKERRCITDHSNEYNDDSNRIANTTYATPLFINRTDSLHSSYRSYTAKELTP